MEPFDLPLRALTTAQLLFLAGLLLVRRERTRTTRTAALLPIGLAAYMVTSAPGAALLAAWLLLPLTVLGVANPLWFWLLGEALFADELRIELRWLAPVLVVIAAGAWHETFGGDQPPSLARASIAFILACGLVLTVLLAMRLDASDALASDEPRVTPAVPSPKPINAALVEQIQHAMRVERLYRRESLTVAELARAIGSQEYLVRRAINGDLGHRNFNDFLHTLRLGEAAPRLLSQPGLPILTIALDVGYGSIGPFNRAFRARFGMTPSEYRARTSDPQPSAGLNRPPLRSTR